MKYSLDVDLKTIAKIKQVFNRQLFSSPAAGCASEAPIFVVGMPRTGTTLVERILGAHTQVYAAGELMNFSAEMTRQVLSAVQARSSRDELIEFSSKLSFSELGNAYIDSTKPDTEAADHFADKLPFNYLYLGLIHLALPKAKIVHVERDPMDNCYAIYKTLFDAAYPFSYDLDKLGRYYLAYRQLMDHWSEVLPNRFYNLQYEKLLETPEQQTKALLAYCNLPWEDACLSFYQNPQSAKTASASQIREPIYGSSVGNWRNYQQQLEPLHSLFAQAGC